MELTPFQKLNLPYEQKERIAIKMDSGIPYEVALRQTEQEQNRSFEFSAGVPR